MADSTLDPDNIPAGADRTLGRGHGTRALGPSDNSDSGSDMVGQPGAEMDSDTDAQGTGERASVGREDIESDIGYDHVETMPETDGDGGEMAPDENAERDVPPQARREERRN
ncbi:MULTISPECIES: hypothetical protein [unclassified Duganella]|jgi:hypothetical protein|uniref:hypothetical protein n=1 Tax=unclassified Duganella TaxID=2636909 RepID=UPI00088A010E|nr:MULTISPECIES: hypothetical protein [unclassified Duganella]SDH34360.1 hypothetical protein SAMN05216320_11293 [Duganella sp. OV458]SDK50940.1 hypothetical protein SAMN05428973_11293 [Duganella sp. OV510]